MKEALIAAVLIGAISFAFEVVICLWFGSSHLKEDLQANVHTNETTT